MSTTPEERKRIEDHLARPVPLTAAKTAPGDVRDGNMWDVIDAPFTAICGTLMGYGLGLYAWRIRHRLAGRMNIRPPGPFSTYGVVGAVTGCVAMVVYGRQTRSWYDSRKKIINERGDEIRETVSRKMAEEVAEKKKKLEEELQK